MQLSTVALEDPTIVAIPPFFIAPYGCCVVACIEASKVMSCCVEIIKVRWFLTLTDQGTCTCTTWWERWGHVVGQIQRGVGWESNGSVDLIREGTLEAEPLEMNEKDVGESRDG